MQYFKNVRVEFHILQSFPVSCLNRDDVGAPKTALVGGVTRARVSSQCWKRQVRLAMQELGVPLAIRTKHLADLIYNCILEEEKTGHKLSLQSIQDAETRAKAIQFQKNQINTMIPNVKLCSHAIAEKITHETLVFISHSEIKGFAKYARIIDFNPAKIKDKELVKIAKEHLNLALDGLDIALFGRMVAKAPEMDIEAAASFSHAISTHKVSNEVEFFTAMDDFKEEPNSAHIGSLEFNSATYYRYISLDLGQLEQSLTVRPPASQDSPESSDSDHLHQEPAFSLELMRIAVSHFIKALFLAIPTARQTTLAAASPWDFAQVVVREGQGLQIPFESPISAHHEGYLKPSIDYIKSYLAKKEKMYGSLYGKWEEFQWGENENYSIDDLISDILHYIDTSD